MIGATVCPTCKGRGTVFYARQTPSPCPTCGNAGPKNTHAQHDAAEAARACWAKYRLGHTGAFNMELAIRRCLEAGLSIDAIHRRTGVSTELARAVSRGQGLL